MAPRMPSIDEIMDERDDNNDGVLTFDEFKDGARRDPETTFAALDTDGDATVTRDELEAGRDRLRERLRR